MRFSISDKRQIAARKLLEGFELNYRDKHGIEAPLPHILTDMLHDYEYGKPSPVMTEKRLMNIVLKQLETMQALLQDIYEREPVLVQQALVNQAATGKPLDTSFIDSMFDDFNNDGNDERE